MNDVWCFSSFCVVVGARSRNADGRLRMASSASPRRNRSRRASLSSDMSSSSSSDTDGSTSVVLGPAGGGDKEPLHNKGKKTRGKHRHTSGGGGGRWGSETSSSDLELSLLSSGSSSEKKSLRVQTLLAGQAESAQAQTRKTSRPLSSPSLNLQVKTGGSSSSGKRHNTEVRTYVRPYVQRGCGQMPRRHTWCVRGKVTC